MSSLYPALYTTFLLIFLMNLFKKKQEKEKRKNISLVVFVEQWKTSSQYKQQELNDTLKIERDKTEQLLKSVQTQMECLQNTFKNKNT